MNLRATTTRGLAALLLSTALAAPAHANGRTEIVVRAGDNAPGAPDTVFSVMGLPALNSAGQIAFWSRLIGPGAFDTADNGIWRDDTLVARRFDVAPGTGGGTFALVGVDRYSLNEAGQVAFGGTLFSGSGGVTDANNAGIWRSPADLSDPTTLVARTNSPAPGTDGRYSGFWTPFLSDSGEVAFRGRLTGGTVTNADNLGIWRGGSLLVRTGSQAPGLPAGAVFQSISAGDVNASGQVAYSAALQVGAGGVTATNSQSLWRGTTLIARTGNIAPGTTPGTLFQTFSLPVLNDAGQVAYSAFLTGSDVITGFNNLGIWRGNQLVVRRGDLAAGTDGARFLDLGNVAIGEANQVAFTGTLRLDSGDVDPSNRRGLWIYGANGDRLLVARSGDTLDGRTIAGIEINGNEAMNDFGQLAYRVTFASGTDPLDVGNEALAIYTPDLRWTRNSGGSWDTAFNWTVGQAPGRAHDTFIDPDTSLTVTGPTGPVTVRALTLGGGTGIGTLALNGGALTALEGMTIEATGRLTGAGGIIGDVLNRGEVVGDSVVIAGQLTNEGRLRARAGDDRIAADTILNRAGGLIDVRPGEGLTLEGAVESLGETRVLGGRLDSRGAFDNAAGARINAQNATLDFAGGLANAGRIQNTAGVNNLFGATHNKATGEIIQSGLGTLTLWDDLRNDGTVRTSEDAILVLFGDLTGSGSFTGTGRVFLEGSTLAPGTSPGVLRFDNLDMSLAGGASFFLGGTERGTEYSGVDVDNALMLGGLLSVTLGDGFLPSAGDSFDLMLAGMLSGSFAGFDLPEIGALGLGWETEQTATRFTLRVNGDGVGVIPLPAGGWLLLTGFGALALLRRRRPSA